MEGISSCGKCQKRGKVMRSAQIFTGIETAYLGETNISSSIHSKEKNPHCPKKVQNQNTKVKRYEFYIHQAIEKTEISV